MNTPEIKIRSTDSFRSYNTRKIWITLSDRLSVIDSFWVFYLFFIIMFFWIKKVADSKVDLHLCTRAWGPLSPILEPQHLIQITQGDWANVAPFPPAKCIWKVSRAFLGEGIDQIKKAAKCTWIIENVLREHIATQLTGSGGRVTWINFNPISAFLIAWAQAWET